MIKDYNTIKNQATKIKNEVEDGANTAQRVGQMLEDIVDSTMDPSINVPTFDLITEINVSKLFPKGGVGGTNKYTLEGAIAKIPAKYRTVGIKCSFLNEAGEQVIYQLDNNDFNSISSWTQLNVIWGKGVAQIIGYKGTIRITGGTYSSKDKLIRPIFKGEVISDYTGVDSFYLVKKNKQTLSTLITKKNLPYTAEDDYYYASAGTTGELTIHIKTDIETTIEEVSNRLNDYSKNALKYDKIFNLLNNGKVLSLLAPTSQPHSYFNMASWSVGTIASDTIVTNDSINCAAYKIDCKENDVFIAFAKSKGAFKLYAILDKSNKVLKIAETDLDTRLEGVEIVIPADGAKLLVNNYEYDKSLDRLLFGEDISASISNIRNVSDNNSARIDSVDASVKKINNKIDNIKGGVIEEKIAPTAQPNSYFNMASISMGNKFNPNIVTNTGIKCAAYLLDCAEGDSFKIYGKSVGAFRLYAILDKDNIVLGFSESSEDTRKEGKSLVIPKTGAKLLINNYEYNENIDKVLKISNVVALANDAKKLASLALENADKNQSLNGKTILFVGDSITEFTGVDKKRYSDHFEEITGATCVNIGIGGTQLRRRKEEKSLEDFNLMPEGDSGTQNWNAKLAYAYSYIDIVSVVTSIVTKNYTKLEVGANWCKEHAQDDNTEIIKRIKQVDLTKVDAIVFLGGTNDFSNGAGAFGEPGSEDVNYTLGAVNYMIKEIYKVNPKIAMYWFSPIVRWFNYKDGRGDDSNWSDVYVRGGHTLKQFCDKLGNEIKKYNLPYGDLYNNLGWNKFNFSNYFIPADGTHPLKGYWQMASKIATYISSNKIF